RKWKDRKKVVAFPLFPGYLFVEFDENKEFSNEVIKVLKTPGVVSLLSDRSGKPKVVPKEDILDIKKLVESNKDIDPYPYLVEGQMVRIVNGALKGVTGILLKKESIDYLIVTVEILKRSVCVKLDPSDVEKF
ncbi:MAG: hypothetical protein LDL13_01270, partial [Calditerrivibrio sp.]|nr:hypothetical protein [Calditerrivibrio sp.]